MDNLAQIVIEKAYRNEVKLATAESCTGGMVCAALTSISGSSTVVEGGFITYSNEMKVSAIGVSEKTIETHGAVSSQTAEEMAKGAKSAASADIAVSITGIAGPTGGSEEKPVGLVYFGLATNTDVKTDKKIFSGERDDIRTSATEHALKLILEGIQDA